MSRKRITKHEFLDAKGRAVDRASTEATTLHYTVIGGGTLDFDLTALNKKDMSEVLAGFLHMGLTTAFNNAAAVKGGDPSPAGRFAHLQKRVKAWEAGEWSTGARGGGGASSLLVAAIVRYLAENGKPQSEEKVATTLGRNLRAMGFCKLSARPQHYVQNPEAIEAFKKTSPTWSKTSASGTAGSR